jgi:hypothetical protein
MLRGQKEVDGMKEKHASMDRYQRVAHSHGYFQRPKKKVNHSERMLLKSDLGRHTENKGN